MSATPRQAAVVVVVLAAYVLNLAAAAGGAVQCRGPAGHTAIEFACDHGHCSDSDPMVAGPAAPSHSCPACSCVDTPLARLTARSTKDDEAAPSAPVTASTAPALGPPTIPATRPTRAPARAPSPPRALADLRTVVLIV